MDIIGGENEYNMNISRYVSTTEPEKKVDLSAVHTELVTIEKTIREAMVKHNAFLKELGLPLFPSHETDISSQ